MHENMQTYGGPSVMQSLGKKVWPLLCDWWDRATSLGQDAAPPLDVFSFLSEHVPEARRRNIPMSPPPVHIVASFSIIPQLVESYPISIHNCTPYHPPPPKL